MKRSKLIVSLSSFAIVSGLLTTVIQAQDVDSEKPYSEEGTAIHRTVMHPIDAQTVIELGYGETFKTILLSAGITQEMIDSVPEEILNQAAFNYLITNGNENINYAAAAEYLTLLVPDLANKSSDNNSAEYAPDSEMPRPMTYEEAVAFTDSEFFDAYMNSLKTYGITDEMLAKLPEDSVYNAAIAYLTTRDMLGDIKMPYRHFTHLYPEVLTGEALSSETTEKRQERAQQATKKQSQLRGHAQENLTNNAMSLKNLPKDASFTSENGTYTIQYLGVLTPLEAGNQNQDTYMLAIKYEFKNTSDKNVTNFENIFEDHLVVTQNVQSNFKPLEISNYQLNEENSTSKIVEVSPDQKAMGTAYYLLEDTVSPLAISILDGEKISDYSGDLESLIQFPLQSALYQGDADQKYLFDFNTLYLLNPQDELINSLKEKKNIEIGSLTSFELSPEAQLQIKKIDAQSSNAIKVNALHYSVDDNQFINVLAEDGSSLLKLKTESGWKSFQDDKGNTFNIIP